MKPVEFGDPVFIVDEYAVNGGNNAAYSLFVNRISGIVSAELCRNNAERRLVTDVAVVHNGAENTADVMHFENKDVFLRKGMAFFINLGAEFDRGKQTYVFSQIDVKLFAFHHIILHI